MTDSTYNGWRNYATWRINLELVEDYASSLAEDVEGGHVERFADVRSLADAFEEYVSEVINGEYDGSASQSNALDIVRSYASAFVADVDYYEIAEHWTAELVHPMTDEEG